jgi:plastocyanin
MPRVSLWPQTTVIGVAASLAMIAGGCGTAKVIGSGRQLTVALSEYRLAPQTAEIDAGEVTLVAHNYGRETHNLVVQEDGRPQDSMHPIPPGGTEQLTVLLTAGRYTLASTVQSDQALGLYGTLVVR